MKFKSNCLEAFISCIFYYIFQHFQSAKYEGQLSELERQIGELKSQLSEVTQSKDRLQSALQESDGSCSKLQSQVSQYRNVLAETVSAVTQLVLLCVYVWKDLFPSVENT